MDVAQLARETRSSIEVQRAKDGTYYWTLKLYFEEGDQSDTISTLGLIDSELRTYFLPDEAAS